MREYVPTRSAYGDALIEFGGHNKSVVVLDSDLSHVTTSCKFAEKYPERFFNMGIAEANMFCVAAGFAYCGKIPFASTFAVFASGRLDQIRNAICYPELNVKIGGCNGGICNGRDGGSHQAIEDLAVFQVIPSMTVLNPADAVEMKWAVKTAIEHNGPFYIRLGRTPVPVIFDKYECFRLGKGIKIKDGTDVTVISTGDILNISIEAVNELKAEGISAELIHLGTVKPLDKKMIIESAKKTGAIVVIEEGVILGGTGSNIAAVLADSHPCKIEIIGMDDCFGQTGDAPELMAHYGFTKENIIKRCRNILS